MEIRMAQQRDIPELLRLLRQVGEVHHRIRPDIFPAGTLKYDEYALSVLLEERPVFAAMEDDRCLGYCFCIFHEFLAGRSTVARKELYIDDLCVDEACRGQGVATALYRHVCGYAREQNCAFVTLNVWCGNEGAMAFYEKMGLTPRNISMEMSLKEDPGC